jgi:hypothetical protein
MVLVDLFICNPLPRRLSMFLIRHLSSFEYLKKIKRNYSNKYFAQVNYATSQTIDD